MRTLFVHLRHLSLYECDFRPYVDSLDEVLEDWKSYKMAVPTYGAIILNPKLTKVRACQELDKLHKGRRQYKSSKYSICHEYHDVL